MPAPVGTIVSAEGLEVADRKCRMAVGSGPETRVGPDGHSMFQATTHTPSWRARPSTSSRRRLTAAARCDHHGSLRTIPR
jgi:hypothetical protein